MTTAIRWGKNATQQSRLAAMQRIGDLQPSTQDGIDMAKTSNFGGKKAAPFVKGGGRSKTHPNDAKGKARKALVAKAMLRKGSFPKGK